MEKLTPQECFDQLIGFLKDPHGHPHPFIALYDFVWIGKIYTPEEVVDDFIAPKEIAPKGEFEYLMHRGHTTERVIKYRHSAIEVMESGLFRNGLLKGNFKTADVLIKELEKFIMNLAAVVHHMKMHINKSPFDNRPPVRNEIDSAHRNMIDAFRVYMGLLLYYKLDRPRPQKIARIEKELYSLQLFNPLYPWGKNPSKGNRYDPIMDLILCFVLNLPDIRKNRLINLAATHIFELRRMYFKGKSKDLPDISAIGKRINRVYRSYYQGH